MSATITMAGSSEKLSMVGQEGVVATIGRESTYEVEADRGGGEAR